MQGSRIPVLPPLYGFLKRNLDPLQAELQSCYALYPALFGIHNNGDFRFKGSSYHTHDEGHGC